MVARWAPIRRLADVGLYPKFTTFKEPNRFKTVGFFYGVYFFQYQSVDLAKQCFAVRPTPPLSRLSCFIAVEPFLFPHLFFERS